MSKDSLKVHTYGCKVNTYDTGLLEKRLTRSGFNVNSDEPQVHILNTCAVTGEATKEAIRNVRRIKAKNPEATVVLTGCAAQVDGHILDEVPEVDLVIANSHKSEIENLLHKHFKGELEQKVFRSNIFRNEKLGLGGGEESAHTRSFLKIQDGCNSFCSFCIIPYARGKSRSLPLSALVQKVNDLHFKGVKEVVLTGVHIGDYLDEETSGGPYNLAGLVREVLSQTAIPRVRLTSLEPIELSEELFALFQDPRLCDHFHISLQSASSKILSLMKRNYDSKKVQWALERIHQDHPQAFVGMDVIVGFPGESDEDFEETYNNLKKWPWTRIHVFPYSERKGTRAALSEEVVPVSVRKERARRLRELSLERYDRAAAEQVGSVKKVLLLKNDTRDHQRGLSRDYWDIYLKQEEKLSVDREVLIKVTGYERAQRDRIKGFLVGDIQG